MLAIISLLGAVDLHANVRTGQLSSLTRVLPVSVPLCASRAPRPPLGARALDSDVLQPAHALMGVLPYITWGWGDGYYNAPALAYTLPSPVHALASSRASLEPLGADALVLDVLQPAHALMGVLPYITWGWGDVFYNALAFAYTLPSPVPALASSRASLDPWGGGDMRPMQSVGSCVPLQHLCWLEVALFCKSGPTTWMSFGVVPTGCCPHLLACPLVRAPCVGARVPLQVGLRQAVAFTLASTSMASTINTATLTTINMATTCTITWMSVDVVPSGCGPHLLACPRVRAPCVGASVPLQVGLHLAVVCTLASTSMASTTNLATTSGVYALHSRQLFGMVSVKRASCVPPPVLSSAGGGAKASTTFTTSGFMATTTSGGELSLLLVQGQAVGLSLSRAPLTSTLPAGSPHVELSSWTTSFKVSTPTSPTSSTTPRCWSGFLATITAGVEPSHFPVQGQAVGLSQSRAPLTSTRPACSPRFGLSSLTTAFMVSSTTSSISTTTTLSASGWVESWTEFGIVKWLGSWGSLVENRYLADGLRAHNTCVCVAHSHRLVAGLPSSLLTPHWLRYLDVDLEWRRRWALVHLVGTNKMWSHVLKSAREFAAPPLFRTARALLQGSLAFASCMYAWDDMSGSIIPSGFALVSTVSCARDVFGLTFHNLGLALAYVLPGMGEGNFARLYSPVLFWAVIFSRVSGGLAVCVSCSGNDPNCTGGDTCALAKALATNVAVMTGTAAAGKVLSMGEDGKHILPLTWLQFLKPSVLQTLVSLAKRAPTGTPLDISALSIKQLSAHISGGSISVSECRLEFLRRMSEDGVSKDDLLKMQVMCEVLPKQGEDSRFLSPLSKMPSSAGALQFVFALASQIVRGLSGTNKISLNGGDANASSSSSLVSIELKRPQSLDAFSHMLSVWQTLLGATGLANIVIVGPFLSEVVFEVIPVRGWKVALEHFLLYISKIDSGVGWELATATSLGSHDTFIHNALRAAGELKPHNPEPTSVVTEKAGKSKGDNKILWNGKFNTDPSARPCAAFNLGQDHKSLKADGSCPFNHICDQWVSDKGKGGQCKASHSRSACSNPHKVASKQE